MKLRGITLGNVRRFTGKRLSISGIADGLTVVSEANEFGKSTVFDALHALFFQKYGSAAGPVKALQPYAGGAVEVGAEIETDAGRFAVEKRFLSRRMARIVRLSDGATVAQDDEAESWIARMLGGAGDGPAGLLWVRQGLVGLEPEKASDRAVQTDTRRDLLSSVAGAIDEVTGGRRMDRVLRRVAEDLGAIATKTGRKTGAWGEAAAEVTRLEARLADLTAQVDELEGALDQRRADEALLSRLDDPDARARRDVALRAANAALAAARAHAGLVTTARQDRDIAALQARDARGDLDAFLAGQAALAAAEGAAAVARREAGEAEAGAEGARLRHEAAIAVAEATRAALAKARAAQDTARLQVEARKARDTAARLAALVSRAEDAQAGRDAAAARMKASPASADWLAKAEAAAAEVARLDAALQAQGTSLRVDYEGDARLALNGAVVPDGQVVPLNGEALLNLPGIGRMVIHAPLQPVGGAAGLLQARAALAALLDKAGADTIQTARHLAASRAEAERQVLHTGAVLDTLAPGGIGELRVRKAEADLAAAGATDDPAPDMDSLHDALLRAAEAETQAAMDRHEAADIDARARETVARTRAAAENAAQTLDRAMAAAGPEHGRDALRADLLRAEAKAAETLAAAETALQQVAAAAPDLTTCEAEARRAEDAAAAATRQRAQVAERLAALSARIGAQAERGIEERRDEVAGLLEAARATEAGLARRAAALSRLLAALEAARAAAQETYFGPVQEELAPLLSILHRDAALTFDSDSLLPAGLRRGLAEEALDNLSGGTREQIAILTRLAFARLFARQGRHMPIVLDDALVHSDDDRIIQMFTALTRVAQDQQILVFSCRQLAFQDLGGARPEIAISAL